MTPQRKRTPANRAPQSHHVILRGGTHRGVHQHINLLLAAAALQPELRSVGHRAIVELLDTNLHLFQGRRVLLTLIQAVCACPLDSAAARAVEAEHDLAQ